jgi:hypothetical protein
MYTIVGCSEDLVKHQYCLIRLARLSVRQAINFYKPVIYTWEWKIYCREINTCHGETGYFSHNRVLLPGSPKQMGQLAFQQRL